jgi:YD repeat-containing protein
VSYDTHDTLLSKTTSIYNQLKLRLETRIHNGDESKTLSYIYDSAGNLMSEKDFAGSETLYSYDALMRLSSSTNSL